MVVLVLGLSVPSFAKDPSPQLGLLGSVGIDGGRLNVENSKLGATIPGMVPAQATPIGGGLSGVSGQMSGGSQGMMPPGLGSMEAFPPFFGETSADNHALLGTWSAQQGNQRVDLIFKSGGVVEINQNGVRIPGNYQAMDNQLRLRFVNGASTTLTYKIEGNVLSLSDGSRLVRQDSTQTTISQPVTQPLQPMPSGNELEGIWVAGNGQVTLIMMFKNGICGLQLNGQQLYGPYTVQGNHLHVQFSNGKPLDVDFQLEGDVLKFSDGTILRRQNMPTPQPSPTPQPMGSPLEGRWGTQLQNGMQMIFVFQGNQYQALINGQLTETGTFVLNGNRLEYTVLTGPNQGQRGVNQWQVNGTILVMTLPNGAMVQFMRQ